MITGIAHVAFRVTDLQRALDFYCGKLGFREAFRLEREGQPAPWIVYVQVAPGQFIELFPRGEGMVAPRSTAAGYNHYCLIVDDLSETLRELRARGLAVTGEPRQGMDTNWQYWIEDPDGNAIELMQVAVGSPQATADAAWAARQQRASWLTGEAGAVRRSVGAMTTEAPCPHFQQIQPVKPHTTRGCEDCLAIGGTWVHLRLCMSCGHVGCCDSSPNRHATRHNHDSGHPVVASFEPGEAWMYCYSDDVMLGTARSIR